MSQITDPARVEYCTGPKAIDSYPYPLGHMMAGAACLCSLRVPSASTGGGRATHFTGCTSRSRIPTAYASPPKMAGKFADGRLTTNCACPPMPANSGSPSGVLAKTPLHHVSFAHFSPGVGPRLPVGFSWFPQSPSCQSRLARASLWSQQTVLCPCQRH
jgi:hypothetical protein